VILTEFGLYYITHKQNLASIHSRGLLALNEVLRRGLTRVDVSNQDVQTLRERHEPIRSQSIHDYVPLYLNPRNPMLFALRELRDVLVILKVANQVAQDGQAIFCDGNAASATTQFSLDEGIVASSIEALRAEYWTGIEDGKRRRMAEVLIHQRVAPDQIEAVLCPNGFVANEVRSEHGLYALTSPSRFF